LLKNPRILGDTKMDPYGFAAVLKKSGVDKVAQMP